MKRITAVLLLICMCAGLCACGEREEESSEPENDSITLNVVTSYGGDDGNRKNFEAAVRKYEAVTGNTVNDDSANSNEDWKAKVLTDFMTGSEPDVLFYFTNADADPLINAGRVVSIEEIRQVYPDYATNMKESMMAAADDGQHYAVPAYGYWENMFVNKRVLAECGVDIPGPDYTWGQFLADCDKIKDAGYTPVACSMFEVPHYWFEFMLLNNGSLENHLELPELNGNGRLAGGPVSDKWVAALEDMKYLYDCGYFPSNCLTAMDSETVDLFAQGKAAFLIDGSWKVGYFTEKYPDRLDDFAVSYVPGRGDRLASEAIGGISMGYFISRKAWDDPAKREAAVKFVFHMTSEEVLSRFVTTEVTALVNGARPTGLNTLQQSAADVNNNISGVVGAVQDTMTREAKQSLFGNIQNQLRGNMDAEAVVEAAMRAN